MRAGGGGHAETFKWGLKRLAVIRRAKRNTPADCTDRAGFAT